MSTALASRYSKELRRAFGLWPTWLPDSAVAVGDVGRIEAGVFVRETCLGERTGAVEAGASRRLDDHFFATRHVNHSVGAVLGAAGSSAERTTGIKVEFTKGFGLIVALHGCRERRVVDLAALEATLREQAVDEPWPRGRVVVTSVIEAEAGIIAVSSDDGGLLEIATPKLASGSVLDNMDAELNVSAERSLAYRTVVHGGFSPLYRLARLVRRSRLATRSQRDEDTTPWALEEIDAGSGLS